MRIGKGKLRQVFIASLVFITVTALAATVACTPGEAKMIEGILQNVDSANGEITIVTKDGKTVTLTIGTEAQVETEGATSTLETLEPGSSVEVEVKDGGKVARSIKARQAEVEGIIVQIDGSEVTIETEKGSRRTLTVTDQTRIELEEDFPGSLADLQLGIEVEAKFDPATGLALKIEVEEEEVELSGFPPVPATGGWGIIEIRVTDPPPADVTSAVVYLTNIEVHRVSGNTSEWIPIIGAPPSFDLMVVDEVAAILGSANVTAGSFTQIRMDVDRVEVVTADGDNITAEVPSDKLRIVRPFNVKPGGRTVLTLDFDGEKSLVLPGKDIAAAKDRALFKPVVKLLIEHEDKEGEEEEEDEEEGEQGQ